ncbi:MAG: hypothetical protein HWE34_14685 [Methylocystaceae bacterium]|jgi:hypothetical protein|nr:hypothetical protein [Methylocystaceae bacterium]
MLFGMNLRKPQRDHVDHPLQGPYSGGSEEPLLRDLLEDPLVHMVAHSDKIERDDLVGCMESAKGKMRLKNRH